MVSSLNKVSLHFTSLDRLKQKKKMTGINSPLEALVTLMNCCTKPTDCISRESCTLLWVDSGTGGEALVDSVSVNVKTTVMKIM